MPILLYPEDPPVVALAGFALKKTQQAVFLFEYQWVAIVEDMPHPVEEWKLGNIPHQVARMN